MTVLSQMANCSNQNVTLHVMVTGRGKRIRSERSSKNDNTKILKNTIPNEKLSFYERASVHDCMHEWHSPQSTSHAFVPLNPQTTNYRVWETIIHNFCLPQFPCPPFFCFATTVFVIATAEFLICWFLFLLSHSLIGFIVFLQQCAVTMRTKEDTNLQDKEHARTAAQQPHKQLTVCLVSVTNPAFNLFGTCVYDKFAPRTIAYNLKTDTGVYFSELQKM